VGVRGALSTGLLGAALVGTGALFDAEPLYVPGIAFVVLATVAAAWVVSGAHGVTVLRTVGARRALEDEPVAIEITVRSGRLTLPTGVIEDPLLPAPAPLTAGRKTTRIRINARFGRRGRKLLTSPRVVVRDPFGLAVRPAAAKVDDAELLVLPRIEPVMAIPPGGDGAGIAGAGRARPHIAAEVDLDGLRQLRQGTPASRIFWPSIARGAGMMERRLRAESDTRALVLLDPRGAAVEEDLDAAVRAAASLTVHLARAGGCALLLPGDRRPVILEPTLGGWPHAHARLALVEGTMRPSLGALAGRRGPVLYVAARRVHRSPRALANAPGGGRILVVPGELAGRKPSFSVAGCHGYELSGTRAAHAKRVVA
jgi:uncharacterized protein (DUF58 family)